METYIKGNIIDITYQSELIPPAFLRKQEGGINSHKQASNSNKIDLCRPFRTP